MQINRNYVLNQFTNFVSLYDMTDEKIKLKVEHTYRVANNAENLAKSIGLSDEDVALSWLCGMLHDIGRFEQLRVYNTYEDSLSVNHAVFGADMLFKQGLIRKFSEFTQEDGIIEKAIRLHNVLVLPDNLNEREFIFVNILRDADKLDIFKVSCECSIESIYEFPENVFLQSAISNKVFSEAMSCNLVNWNDVRESADKLIGHIAMIFGLELPVSYKVVNDTPYIWQMLDTPLENSDARQKLRRLNTVVRRYVNEKLQIVNVRLKRHCFAIS